MAFFPRYFGHPLVILAISLATATGLLGYSGMGPTSQAAADEYPISSAMRGDYDVASSGRSDSSGVSKRPPQRLGEPAPQTEEASPEPQPQPEIAITVPVKPTVSVHRVAPGENLFSIANDYGVDVNTILGANDILDINTIRVGDELRILSHDGVMHKIEPRETLWEIARKYKATIDDIVAANEITEPNRLALGQELFIPGGIPVKDLAWYKSKEGPELIWPVRGRISSKYGPRWGRMHHGIDIAVMTGTKVVASAAGRVKTAGYSASYGYLVIIDHGKGYETRYAHNSKLLVKTGQRVSQGQVVAYSGNTGQSTGPHLHFEIRINRQTKDPLRLLK